MHTINRSTLELLIRREFPSISLYLPAHRSGSEVHEDLLRMRNMLRNIRAELLALGMSPRETTHLLRPVRSLLRNEVFWRSPDGVALFLSPSLFLPLRLHTDFPEDLSISDHFRLTPLLPLLQNGQEFFILAVSRENVRFLRASESGITAELHEVFPRGLADALRDERQEPQVQFHTIPTGAGLFHGQGALKDYEKVRLMEFLRLVESHVHPVLAATSLPLVFAGSDPLFGLYRGIHRTGILLPESVRCNPEALTREELHRQAWRIVEPLARTRARNAVDMLERLQGTDRVSTDIDAIFPAAAEGRVDLLFLEEQSRPRGMLAQGLRRARDLLAPSPRSEERLLESTAVETALHNGRLFVVPSASLPRSSSLAAVFRY